jgi:acyl-coenzyme A thioesterase PaaI-like protein
LNAIEAELKLHRMMLNALRLGIVHGHLTSSDGE